MEVTNPNNVKVYNLSAGKTIPEWLSQKRRKHLLKKDSGFKRQIQLIQDFDMPCVSTSVRASRDGQYLFATGIYKPRVKCFDLNQFSLKFERCFDSEVVTFELLSDDYSKVVFLQCDRHIELHAAHGKYFRLRIPRFGRDMQYHYPTCDLFVVGASNEIYRLNLERGQFLQPFISESSAINKCTINPVHNLLLVGNDEGKVEAWDPRVRNKVGTLDCGFSCIQQDNKLESIPSITALKCHGSLTLGVGTATGQVMLYDLRSNSPFTVKDHMYGLPIRNIEFHESMDLVYSMDSSILKIWEKQNGKIYTSLEATSDLNDLCVIPNTGMLFMANETAKMQSYYIPSLGPAPRWCHYLDNLTEELEESNFETVYDHYVFVDEKKLDELGLTKYVGTNLMRAAMHGYYIDAKLYKKLNDITKPFDLEEYKKKVIKGKIEEERPKRVQVQKQLPLVNKDLAMKHLENEETTDPKKKKKATPNLLKDTRFSALFNNPDFQVDVNSQEFALMNPVISHLGKTKKRAPVKAQEENDRSDVEDDAGSLHSEDDDMAESSDDEKPWAKDVRKQYRLVKENEKKLELEERKKEEETTEDAPRKPRFYELKDGVHYNGTKYMRKQAKASLGDRLQREESNRINVSGSRGNKEMTFTIGKKNYGKKRDQNKTSRQDMKHLLRPAKNFGKFKKRN